VIKNLNSIFWAYAFGWAVFFLDFNLSIAKRSNDLRSEVERPKEIRVRDIVRKSPGEIMWQA